MPLKQTFSEVKNGIINIQFLDSNSTVVGGGSGFLVNEKLVTNYHVAFQPTQFSVKVVYDGGQIVLTGQEFRNCFLTTSDENSFDYAILDIPNLPFETLHNFTLGTKSDVAICDHIALLGYPFSEDNLVCHQGMISSFFQKGIVDYIQIDASVNSGNSGGPLIIPETGVVVGIITRKATGLTEMFENLRNALQQNIQTLSNQSASISIGGIDPVEGIKISLISVLHTLKEIERSANVGIGFAFSIDHIKQEPLLQDN